MRDNSRFYVPVLSFLTLVATILVIRFWPDDWTIPPNIMRYICEQSRCTIQDWLSATAGWVGLAVAAVGAYFVYHQLKEQRKQTAFVLGDGEAVLQMHVFAMENQRSVLRLINWNRRDISIIRVRIFCKDVDIPKPVALRWYEPNFKDHKEIQSCELDASGNLDMIPAAEGWIDRQGKPGTLDFELVFDNGVEDFVNLIGGLTTKSVAEIKVSASYEDGTESKVAFKLNVPIIDFLPNSALRFHLDHEDE